MTTAAPRLAVDQTGAESTGRDLVAYPLSSLCGAPVHVRTKSRPVTLSRQRSRIFGQVSAQRDRLIMQIDALTDERNESRALVTAKQQLAIADERERIARDLHDTVIQRLFAAGIGLQGAMGHGDPRNDDVMDRIVTEIDLAIRDIRDSIFHLQRPVRLVGTHDAMPLIA